MKKKVLLSMALLSAVAVGIAPVTANASGVKTVQVQVDGSIHRIVGQKFECLKQIVIKHGVIIANTGNSCQNTINPDVEIPDTSISGSEKPGIETSTPDPGHPDVEKPDAGITDTAKPDTGASGAETPDTTIPDSGTPDTDISETPSPNTPGSSEGQLPGTQKPGADESNDDESSYAQQVVKLVNEERAKAGLPALEVQTKITAAANIRAKEIKQKFSHTRPDGSNFSSVLKSQGVSFSGSGENIAYGQKSPEKVMEGWMNSSGHRANILNKNYKYIGVGYYQDEKGVKYWVQLFTY